MRREQIDAWPIATSGLISRPVTCLSRAGIRTIGDLRAWTDAQLLDLPVFGALSLANVHWFFDWTRRLEAGRDLPADCRQWLHEFLSPHQRTVIELRFGLTDPLFRPWMKRATLREIGIEAAGGITRERVRQVEDDALARLRTHLARALVEPLCAKIAGASRGAPVLGGYEPWGAALLLESA